MVDLLRRNVDVFAWDAYEIPGLDPNFICHHLNVNSSITPKRQPPRRPSKEHVKAVKSEVTKLKQAGAIKEVFHRQTGAGLSFFCCTNGKNLSGPKSVL